MKFGMKRLLLATVAIALTISALTLGLAAFSGTEAAVIDQPSSNQELDPATQTPVQEQLFAGWNLESWKIPGACKEARAAVTNLISDGSFNVMWQFVAADQSWLGFDANVPDVVNSLRELCQGTIVWINVSANATWTQSP
jgi:hypothetical protein